MPHTNVLLTAFAPIPGYRIQYRMKRAVFRWPGAPQLPTACCQLALSPGAITENALTAASVPFGQCRQKPPPPLAFRPRRPGAGTPLIHRSRVNPCKSNHLWAVGTAGADKPSLSLCPCRPSRKGNGKSAPKKNNAEKRTSGHPSGAGIVFVCSPVH